MNQPVVRTMEILNIKNEPIRITVVGGVIRQVEPVRAVQEVMMSRRDYERRERACVDCPPIA